MLLVVERCPTDTPAPTDRPHDDDPWTRWWAELGADRALRPALAERAVIMSRLESAEFVAPTDWHLTTARAAGHTDTRLVCRRGDRVLLAMNE